VNNVTKRARFDQKERLQLRQTRAGNIVDF
jgi:hypothetical protein